MRSGPPAACFTGWPRNCSAVSFIFTRIMLETSSALKTARNDPHITHKPHAHMVTPITPKPRGMVSSGPHRTVCTYKTMDTWQRALCAGNEVALSWSMDSEELKTWNRGDYKYCCSLVKHFWIHRRETGAD